MLHLFVLLYLVDISGGLQVMVPYMYEQFISNLTYEVKSGNIPMSRIDDAVARILQVKFETGLFEHPYANKGLKSFIGQQVITCPHDSWIQEISIVCTYVLHWSTTA